MKKTSVILTASATPSSTPELLALTAQIVAAHVAGNKVPAGDLPALIDSVYAALAHAGAPVVEVVRQEPAVPIKRSIQPDYLVCLEDGAKLKTLKRYLQRFDLTPEAYRAKWGLPDDYPMTAPAYSAKRSAMAKQLGLGTALRSVAPAPEIPDVPEAPTVAVEPGVQHTAASVFADFPGGEHDAEAVDEAKVPRKPGRKQFAQQFTPGARKRAGTRPM